jgi:hypothetical protein
LNINDLENITGDPRGIENLYDGKNDCNDNGNVWLAPFINYKGTSGFNLGRTFNFLVINFYRPVRLSGANFYNYSKTPMRGLKDFEMFLDDALIWKVSLLA